MCVDKLWIYDGQRLKFNAVKIQSLELIYNVDEISNIIQKLAVCKTLLVVSKISVSVGCSENSKDTIG